MLPHSFTKQCCHSILLCLVNMFLCNVTMQTASMKSIINLLKLSVEMHAESSNKLHDTKSKGIKLLKNSGSNLEKDSLKVPQNKNSNKSKARKIVQRNQHYNGRSSRKRSLNNIKKPLTEYDRSRPINFTSTNSISYKLQKPSTAEIDKTNENSTNSIAEVKIEKGVTKEQLDKSLTEINFSESETFLTVASTLAIKNDKAEELQNYSGTNDNFDEKRTNEITENSLLEEIISKYEVQNSQKYRRRKHNYLCQYCPLITPDIGQLSEHEKTHLKNRERNIVCSICGIKFYTKLSLKCHMDTHDENRTKKHKCEYCEKAFFNKGSLNLHRRIHLGLMYKCQICQKEYYRQLDLDRHLLTHSVIPQRKNIEKKKYFVECQYCKKSVLTNKMKDHIAVHSNQPQAQCMICEKEFCTRSRCTNHLRRFHKVDSSDYAKYLHSYVKSNGRASFLEIRQESQVQHVT